MSRLPTLKSNVPLLSLRGAEEVRRLGTSFFTIDEILRDYPHITNDDVNACLKYTASALKNDILIYDESRIRIRLIEHLQNLRTICRLGVLIAYSPFGQGFLKGI